jgi:large subunit ribosomal protein L10
MPTKVKSQKIEDLQEKLNRSKIAILVQTQGLSVKDMNELRKRMRTANVEFQVTKNTLLRIASERNELTLDPKLFEGPTTVAYGYDDEIVAAKAVTDYVRTSKVVTVKSAILGGRALNTTQVEGLAKIVGGKDQIRAEVVGAVQSPLSSLYGTLTAPMRELVYILQGRVEQLQGGSEESAQA